MQQHLCFVVQFLSSCGLSTIPPGDDHSAEYSSLSCSIRSNAMNLMQRRHCVSVLESVLESVVVCPNLTRETTTLPDRVVLDAVLGHNEST